MTKERFPLLQSLSSAAGDIEREARDALAEIERLQKHAESEYKRGYAVGSGDEGHYQREIARLRAALERAQHQITLLTQRPAVEPTAAPSFAEIYRQQSETKQGGTTALNESARQHKAPPGRCALQNAERCASWPHCACGSIVGAK